MVTILQVNAPSTSPAVPMSAGFLYAPKRTEICKHVVIALCEEYIRCNGVLRTPIVCHNHVIT